MNKRKMLILIGVLLFISLGTTLAWYVWQSNINTNISLNFCVPEISFVGGTTIQGENLLPTVDKEKGLKKQIEVKLNGSCAETSSAVMNLYMRTDYIDTELRNETFIFEVVKDGEVLYSGNFKDKVNNQTIELLTNEIITETSSVYYIYVYIDGSKNNPVSMSGKNFLFTVWGEGTDAIYKSNVIQNEEVKATSSSSTFLNTSLKRSEIQSITITENNIVPDEAKDTSQDISANQNGSVMLWYTKDEATNLYDVYIGSKTGIVEANTSAAFLFSYLENVKTLDLTRFDTTNVINMQAMFVSNKSLTSLNIDNFNTSNVRIMENMFQGCTSLTSLNLDNWDTSKVTSMYAMFYNCTSLTSLNIENWITSNVTRMDYMFFHCTSLTSLNLDSWNTSKVTNMYAMFDSCASLTSLNLDNWDTSNVTNMYAMFYNCTSLTNINLDNWNTSNVITMSQMFSKCTGLTSLNLDSWDTSKVTDISQMFYTCTGLTNLNIENWDTSNVTNMLALFGNCTGLTSLNLKKWNTKNVTNMSALFGECLSLTSLDLSGWNTENVTNMSFMFAGMDESSMNLATIGDISNWNTAKVTNMRGMFRYCNNLTSLDLSGWNTSKVTNMALMFEQCTNLKTIYVGDNWNTAAVTSSAGMFNGCTSLVGSSGTTYNASFIDKTYAIVDEGTSSPGYFTYKNSSI